jgi:hypothetical protein
MTRARDLADFAGVSDGPLSFRNKIINGNFDFWQRGTSGSSGYVADRWTTAVGGSTAAISRQSFTLGQTDVPGEPDYYHRTVVTSSAGASNYAITLQRIESVKTLAGQTATLSFWAKADASKNMAIEFFQSFGTGGSPSTGVTFGVTTIALTTSWQKFTVTVDVPSISGKTLGTNDNDYLFVALWFDAGSDYDSSTNTLGQQSGTFDIARVQLEAGDVATPFEERPIGQELALCHRYYQKVTYAATSTITVGITYNTTVATARIDFLQEMRAAPSITLPPAGQTSGTITFLNNAGFPSATGSHSAGAIDSHSFRIDGAGYTGLAGSGYAAALFPVSGSSVSFLFDAEL